MAGYLEAPQNEKELLTLLQHPDPDVKAFGWNCFFQMYSDSLYLDARRSLLKRGVTDNLEEDAFTIIREMWLKVALNISTFEYRSPSGLYHYARSFLAFESFNLRRARQKEIRHQAMTVSLDEADDSGGDPERNALHLLIYHSTISDTDNPFDTDDDHLHDVARIAVLLVQRLSDNDRALLIERYVNRSDYKSLARLWSVTPNHARQLVFRAKHRLFAAFKALVTDELAANRIAYGTARWLMTYIQEAA